MKKSYIIISFFTSVLFICLITTSAFSQLSGIKTIPGNYASIAAAITDLNAVGVGSGGVTFNVTAGYTEIAANLIITSTGTAANPIVFQKSGSGTNPTITAGVGTSTTVDGIIKLSGTDFITFDGIDVKDTSSNTTTTTQMEWGYAILKVDGINGCRSVTVKNCNITLTQSNTAAVGIYSANHTVSSTTALTVSDTNGTNSYNRFYSNVISSVNTGIWMGGYSAAAYYDVGNEVGTTGTGQNRIYSYGSTTTAYGVYGIYQSGMKVFNSSINNSGGLTSTSTLYGVFLSTGLNSNVDIYGDTISVISGSTTSSVYGISNAMGGTGTSNTVNISNNVIQNCSYATATTGSIYFIYQSTSCYNMNITGNKIINNNYGSASTTSTGTIYFIYTLGGTAANNIWQINNNLISGFTRTQSALSTGTHYFIYNSASGVTMNINGNTISDCVIPSTSVAYGIYPSSSYMTTFACSNNTIKNISRPNASTGGFYCFYHTSGASGGTADIYNNSFRDVTISGAGTIYGLYTSASMDKNVYGDTIYNLNTTGGSIYGLYTSTGNTTKFYNNKVTALYTTSGTIYGGYIAGGTTNYFYNNYISDLRATTATGAVSIAGIYSSSGTNNYLFYNTIYLNASSTSAATFGTAGIYASTTPILDMRNNIIVNTSTPGPTGGFTSAYFRNAFNFSTYAAASNNNIFYAGTPSSNRLIYYDGTNLFQSIALYKQLVTPRESNSFTENPPFVNISTVPYDLHISTSTPTGIESSGIPITSPIAVNNDYDNQTRNILLPDIGADEGNFTPGDLQAPAISYTPLTNANILTDRTLIAVITDNIAVENTSPNDPRIYFKKGINSTFKYRNKTSQSGNNYTFSIVVDSIGGLTIGDTVYYYVAAQDNGSTPPIPPNVSTNPLGGGGINPPGTVPPIPANKYIVTQAPLSGVYTIPGTPYATLTAALNDVTLRGIGSGGVTLNVTAGYTETAANLLIEALGTSASNQLIIQKSGAGINPLITAAAGTGTMDGIIKISGTDYVTIDGIDLQEDSVANINTTTQMEWGYSILKPDGSNGARYVTIKNCNIKLNKLNTSSVGIYVNNHTPAATTPLLIADSLGTNSNNKFYNNTISNVNSGIWIGGYADQSLYDLNNEIGNTAGLQNKIFNYGSTTTAYGVYSIYQSGFKVFNTNINNTGGVLASSGLYGIYTGAGVNSNVDIYGDTITLVNAGTTGAMGAIYNTMGATGTSNTINIYNNVIQNCTYSAATSGTVYFIYMSVGSYNVNIYGNQIINNTYGSASATATGSMYFIYTFGGTAANNIWQIYNNTISNNSRVQSVLGTGLVYLIYNSASGTTLNVYGNNVSDNSFPSSSTLYGMYMTSSYMTSFNFYSNVLKNISRPNASTGAIYALYHTGGAASGTANIYNNSFNNLSISGSGYIYGLYSSNASVDKNIYQDTIYALSTGGSYIYGLYSVSGINTKIYQNKVSDLSVSNDTTGYVYGMYIAGGTTNYIYNNFISDLKATASSVSPCAAAGMYITGGTTNNVFFNTIYLNASSTAALTFSTAGLYITASTSYTLDMRDNIIVNNSTPAPTGGYAVAYRRSGTVLTSYSNNSNNNCLYAGTPGANNLIFYDGTNADQTITAFQTRVAPRDNASFTENVPFVNVTVTPYDLHVSASVPTKVESNGITITTPLAITNDYDNQTRSSNPDVGADEGTFIPAIPNAPVPILPANGATNVSLTPLIDWSDVVTAVSYRIQVSSDSTFASTAFDTSGITGSQITVPAGKLIGSTLYYWRCNAANVTGTGPWCNKWYFTTLSPIPAPTLIFPANNATGITVTPLFDWADITEALKNTSDNDISNVKKLSGKDNNNAITYTIQVAADTTFTSPIINISGLNTSQYQVSAPGLGLFTIYYWRVRATDVTSGPWSAIWKFTTGQVVLNLTIIPGGFYNSSSNTLNMRDTLKAYLIDTTGGGHRIDSAAAKVDSVTFIAQFKFDNAPAGSYYIYIYHRNHLPISTASLQSLIRTAPNSYNFTDAANKTYGSNVIQVSTSPARWGMIPGDANQDEYVDAFDQFIWIAQNGLDGYLSADFNGDTYVDAFDQFIWIAYNGNSSFLPVIFPGPTQTSPIRNSQGVKKTVIDNRQIDFNKQKDFKNQNDLKK
jgi:hypothetical protein